MIAELAADILARVRTVTSFSSSSLTVGGKALDPGLLKLPLPATWIKFGSDISDEQSYEHGLASGIVHDAQTMMATFLVTILVPYTTDDDLLTVQYPLLESVISAVHTDVLSPSGFRWRYAGQRIALVYTDRLAYEQRFTVNHVTQLP